jgi:drug/metabolite transporter (DMT)-like permease
LSRTNLIRLGLIALFWGSSFLWIKVSLQSFTPVQIVFVRLALGAAVLTPVALLQGKRFPAGRRVWAHLFIAALVGNAVPGTLVAVGAETIDSSVGGVLNATAPLWTVLVAAIAGTDRRMTIVKAVGIATGFAGILLIFTPWQSAAEIASWGALAGLGAAACYGTSYVYIGRFLTGTGLNSVVLSASQLAAGAALTALALPFGGLTMPVWRADAVAALLVLGAFGTGAAYLLNYRLVDDVGPTAASISIYLLPVVAIALGYFVLDEPVTTKMIAGTATVLAAVALVNRAPRVPARASRRAMRSHRG